MNKVAFLLVLVIITSCGRKSTEISPDVITETVKYDTDDPAIWVNPEDASKSIVFGTDKETDGAIYAFDLDGKIMEDKTIRNLKRPNNVDIEYGFMLNDSTTVDIVAFTERERQQIRVFSVPDMQPLDNGGFKVFENDTLLDHNLPMGIALFKSQKTHKVYAIVGRKSGPLTNYLHQYELMADSSGVQAHLVRKFGSFSGKKEIEAIVVDDEEELIYYSDEGHCIRVYKANPAEGNNEINCFGGETFKDDIEGLAIAKLEDKQVLIVSNQQAHTFNVFDLEDYSLVKSIDLGTTETDGCEVTTLPLGDKFPNGLFVSMDENKTFFYHDLSRLKLTEK